MTAALADTQTPMAGNNTTQVLVKTHQKGN